MGNIFVVEDTHHAELIGEYSSLADAWLELERLSAIPWNERPNVAPCMSWQSCGRSYGIIEYEKGMDSWQEIRRLVGLEISADKLSWGPDAPRHGT